MLPLVQVSRETCGKVLESVIGEIFLAGAKPIPEMELQRVDRAMADLGIESEVAMEVLSEVSGGEAGELIALAWADESATTRGGLLLSDLSPIFFTVSRPIDFL